jgi:pseudouridine kinase
MNSSEQSIACIGGVVMDHKVRAAGEFRPGTSNPVTATTSSGGVAANIAQCLGRLGCCVRMFSILGDDRAADTVLRELKAARVDVDSLSRSNTHPTANYSALLQPNGELFIGLADMAIFEELDPAWADRIAPRLAESALWVVDANLPAATIDRLLLTHKRKATVLADPISIDKSARFRRALASIDVFFPNRKEAAELTGHTVETRADVIQAAAELRTRGIATVLLTLGGDGVYVHEAQGGRFLPAIPPRQVVDVTGAGDALVAGYAYGMLHRGSHEPALFGLAAASLAVETEGSIPADLQPERLIERIESNFRRGKTHEPIS